MQFTILTSLTKCRKMSIKSCFMALRLLSLLPLSLFDKRKHNSHITTVCFVSNSSTVFGGDFTLGDFGRFSEIIIRARAVKTQGGFLTATSVANSTSHDWDGEESAHPLFIFDFPEFSDAAAFKSKEKPPKNTDILFIRW